MIKFQAFNCQSFDMFGRETFVSTFMLQIAVLTNHLNGRDTHVRQIKVYGPRPCVIILTFCSCTHCFLFGILVMLFNIHLQEPNSPSTFSIYIPGVHHLLLCEIRRSRIKESCCNFILETMKSLYFAAYSLYYIKL